MPKKPTGARSKPLRHAPAKAKAAAKTRRRARGAVYAVTGCSGFIGRTLLRRIADRPAVRRVVGIDLVAPGFTHPKLTFLKADVREPGLTAKLKRLRVDAIIHLAFIVDPF